MLPVIYGFILWIVIPLILIAIFFFSVFLVSSTHEPASKVSAIAGFGAGLLLFIIYVISEVQSISNPTFTVSEFPQWDWCPLVGGAIGGFLFLWGVKKILPTQLIGILTLILSFVSTASFFDYLFVSEIKDLTLFVVLGLAVGILTHLMIFPESLKHLFPVDPHFW